MTKSKVLLIGGGIVMYVEPEIYEMMQNEAEEYANARAKRGDGVKAQAEWKRLYWEYMEMAAGVSAQLLVIFEKGDGK